MALLIEIDVRIYEEESEICFLELFFSSLLVIA